jgi:hypothetical protein
MAKHIVCVGLASVLLCANARTEEPPEKPKTAITVEVSASSRGSKCDSLRLRLGHKGTMQNLDGGFVTEEIIRHSLNRADEPSSLVRVTVRKGTKPEEIKDFLDLVARNAAPEKPTKVVLEIAEWCELKEAAVRIIHHGCWIIPRFYLWELFGA